jgi:hypothetical protein
MQLLPVVPYASYRLPVALRKKVIGYVPDPSGPYNDSFANVGFAAR